MSRLIISCASSVIAIFLFGATVAQAGVPATYVDGDAVYVYQLNAVEPILPVCYAGIFDPGYTPADVNLSTLSFDGLATTDAMLVDSHILYGGSAVSFRFSLVDFLSPMMPLYSESIYEYQVTGLYTDGVPFSLTGNVLIVGKNPGDANTDGSVNISDATFLVNYIFVAGPAPNPLDMGDIDCSGSVDVADVVRLMSYIFAGGPAPCKS